MRADLTPTIDAIQARTLPQGGFSLFEGGPLDPAATAWAILALGQFPGHEEVCGRARSTLARFQLPDGRVPVSPQHPAVTWPTPLFLLALAGGSEFEAQQQRAVDFLLRATGLHWVEGTDATYGHDTSIPGWPWILGTHSWVEPTSLAVLALKARGLAQHRRVAEAVRLLMDRQLPEGGWNYGNTTVFSARLRPLPESTGLALAALAGSVLKPEVAASVAYLKSESSQIRTPMSLSWGILGLAAWDELPFEAGAWLETSLALQTRYGPYDTTLLSLLVVAAAAWAGLPSVFTARERL